MAQNDKNSVCLTPYLGNYTSYDCDFLVRAIKFIFVASSFIFSKFCFCWFLGELKGKKNLKLSISSYHVLYLRNCRLYQDFWYTGVK